MTRSSRWVGRISGRIFGWSHSALALLAILWLCLGLGAVPAYASAVPPSLREADVLLFCNKPERLERAGAYADAKLTGGRTYRIFFHYRNASGRSGPLVIAFQGSVGKPLTLLAHKGIAEPQRDPPRAGQQAIERYLAAPSQRFAGRGGVRFTLPLRSRDVASGILTVRADQDCRLRIYFHDNRRVVAGANVAMMTSPRREVKVHLSTKSGPQYYRIGVPEKGFDASFDGTYGLAYAFLVDAPAGSRVRVTFSPRGGQSGLVGSVNGTPRSSDIIGANALAVFADVIVGKGGLVLTTIPFGGVFYPVELAFHLLSR
jgi:hypothetical protein